MRVFNLKYYRIEFYPEGRHRRRGSFFSPYKGKGLKELKT